MCAYSYMCLVWIKIFRIVKLSWLTLLVFKTISTNFEMSWILWHHQIFKQIVEEWGVLEKNKMHRVNRECFEQWPWHKNLLRKMNHAAIYFGIVTLLKWFGFGLHSKIHSSSFLIFVKVSTPSMLLQNVILSNWLISCAQLEYVHWKYLGFLKILNFYVNFLLKYHLLANLYNVIMLSSFC